MSVTISKENGSGDEVSVQVFPEQGHPSSPMIYKKDRKGRAPDGGRAIAGWIRTLRKGRENVTVVIRGISSSSGR